MELLTPVRVLDVDKNMILRFCGGKYLQMKIQNVQTVGDG